MREKKRARRCTGRVSCNESQWLQVRGRVTSFARCGLPFVGQLAATAHVAVQHGYLYTKLAVRPFLGCPWQGIFHAEPQPPSPPDQTRASSGLLGAAQDRGGLQERQHGCHDPPGGECAAPQPLPHLQPAAAGGGAAARHDRELVPGERRRLQPRDCHGHIWVSARDDPAWAWACMRARRPAAAHHAFRLAWSSLHAWRVQAMHHSRMHMHPLLCPKPLAP